MARRYFIGGNWKSNGTLKSIETLVKTLNTINFDTETMDVCVAPTSIHIPYVKEHLNEKIIISSQNVSLTGMGAYTGEVNAEQLTDMGIQWTLIGHSERRQLYGETDEIVAKKTKFAIDHKLNVILCIGETLQEREAGKTVDVCYRQLNAVKAVLTTAEWEKIVVAYEPVWAIGTGKVATPEQAQEVHYNLRQWFINEIDLKIANSIRIIYGGSVNAGNSEELIALHDVDGFLVGGASLKPEFTKIVQCAQ